MGGYGNFGTRIARALVADRGIELLIGGRISRQASASASAEAAAAAAAAAGAHYIDLADGRRFVCDFPQALQAA